MYYRLYYDHQHQHRKQQNHQNRHKQIQCPYQNNSYKIFTLEDNASKNKKIMKYFDNFSAEDIDRTFFERMDTNHNGFVSREEIKSFYLKYDSDGNHRFSPRSHLSSFMWEFVSFIIYLASWHSGSHHATQKRKISVLESDHTSFSC